MPETIIFNCHHCGQKNKVTISINPGMKQRESKPDKTDECITERKLNEYKAFVDSIREYMANYTGLAIETITSKSRAEKVSFLRYCTIMLLRSKFPDIDRRYIVYAIGSNVTDAIVNYCINNFSAIVNNPHRPSNRAFYAELKKHFLT